MAQRDFNIADVKAPGLTTPAASSRPILVTNRPVLTSDPMIAGGSVGTLKPAEPVNRSTKEIKPVSEAESIVPTKASDNLEADVVDESSDTTPAEGDSTPEAPTEDKPIYSPARTIVNERDAEAQLVAAAEEATAEQDARQQELEKLVEDGTYVVPINAVHRKRSLLVGLAVVSLIIVLAFVVFDVLLDADIIKLSVSIPHTNFL